jgi:protein-L-isoaspartate(D-aspartate) O-methyltransferase
VTGLIERRVARLALGRKVGADIAFTTLGEADFAPIPEFAATKTWSF